jgi:hypothetical protein
MVSENDVLALRGPTGQLAELAAGLSDRVGVGHICSVQKKRGQLRARRGMKA